MSVIIPVIILLPILLFGILCVLIFYYIRKRSQYRGQEGEARVHDILMNLSDEYIVLDDVVLFTTNGTSQIDHIVVSKYGVFTIETKNYRGEIYGNEQQNEWKQIIVTNVRYSSNPFKTYTYVTKNNFYNPVKQSLGHSYVIKDKLKSWSSLPIIPIVCFVGDSDISHVQSIHPVVDRWQLLSVIESYKTIYLNNEDVKEIAQLLSDYNMRNEVSNKSHIRNIKQIKRERETLPQNGICPKCGGKLVQRNGKYGVFFGCSNYPECKFIYK